MTMLRAEYLADVLTTLRRTHGDRRLTAEGWEAVRRAAADLERVYLALPPFTDEQEGE